MNRNMVGQFLLDGVTGLSGLGVTIAAAALSIITASGPAAAAGAALIAPGASVVAVVSGSPLVPQGIGIPAVGAFLLVTSGNAAVTVAGELMAGASPITVSAGAPAAAGSSEAPAGASSIDVAAGLPSLPGDIEFAAVGLAVIAVPWPVIITESPEIPVFSRAIDTVAGSPVAAGASLALAGAAPVDVVSGQSGVPFGVTVSQIAAGILVASGSPALIGPGGIVVFLEAVAIDLEAGSPVLSWGATVAAASSVIIVAPGYVSPTPGAGEEGIVLGTWIGQIDPAALEVLFGSEVYH
jgi:hypothetical protein